jgi:hypothetical protein
MARRAWISVQLIELGDTITLHFEDEAHPPIWFSKRERPAAHAKLKQVLDEEEFVEDLPVVGPTTAPGPGRPGWEGRLVDFPDRSSGQ